MKLHQSVLLLTAIFLLPTPSSAQPYPSGLGAIADDNLREACLTACYGELNRKLIECRAIVEDLEELRRRRIREGSPVSNVQPFDRLAPCRLAALQEWAICSDECRAEFP